MAKVLDFDTGFKTLSLKEKGAKPEKKKKSRHSTKRRSRKIDYLDTEIATDKLVEEITCQGCHKKFASGRVPKILHCLHTLCTECISVSFMLNDEKDKVKCVTCGTFSVGRNAESFRTQSFIQILSDIANCYEGQLSGSLHCIGCSNVAGLRCLTCNENYCQEHTDFHVRSRATSHHKVLSFKQILNAPLLISTIKREEHCPTHPNKLMEFFCFTCRLPLCTACALAQHKDCIYEELGMAITALKQKFENLKPAFNKKQYSLKKADAALDAAQKQVDGELGHSMAGLSDTMDRIMRTLRQRESSINHHIEDHRKEGQGELRVHQSVLEEKIANIESGVDFVDTVFEFWSPLEVLSMEHDILERLSELAGDGGGVSEEIKPKPFELPPDTEGNVVDAICSMHNAALAKTTSTVLEEQEEGGETKDKAEKE